MLAALADVPLDGGDLDPTTYVAAIARELGAQARATDDPQARRVLATFSEDLSGLVEDSLAGTGSEGDSLDFATGLERVRHYGLVVAAVVAALGLVALLVAAAVAVRRGLTAALVASVALVVTALVLAPGEWLLGLGDGLVGALARVVAAAGEFAGTGLVWSLLLASLVPPTLWWAARSARRTRT